jgi:hypothetical protein
LAACDALSEHLVAPQNVLGASYYFRKHWVKALGRGQAWLVMLLRDRCYDRPGDEVRDVCWVPDYDWLAQRVGVDTRTIGGWLNDGLQGFVQIREQRKGWDKTDPQRVGYRVKVQLHDPLTPEDEQEYQRRLANRLAAVEKGRVSAESGLSAPGVRRENAPPEGVRQENGLSKPGVGRESGLSAGGVTRETGPSAERGSGENPSGRESFKVPMIQRESQNNQTSPSKTIFDPIYAALGKLAANDDDGVDLEAVLVGVGVQNPSRKRILKTQPQAGLVLAWILAATSHTSVKQPVAFLVSKLLDPEEAAHPPAPFDVLARLSPKDWTAFALAARRRLAGEEPPWGLNGNAAAFETWWEVYGVAETLWLPLGLGDEAAKLWEEENDGQTAVAVGRARFGKWAADYS